MKYAIVRGGSADELELAVNKSIKLGWEICGSAFVTHESYLTRDSFEEEYTALIHEFFQPMTRK